MAELARIDWRNLVRRTGQGKLLPIISDRVTGSLLFDNQKLIQAWSDDIGYPMGRSYSITRLAQYLSVLGNDPLAAKEEYLSFLKRHYINQFLETGTEKQKVDAQNGDLRRLCLSELVGRLDQPALDDEIANPLRRLAQLPTEIYITTSYHNFLEQALRSVGKEPYVEICYWDHKLKAPVRRGPSLNPRAPLAEAMVQSYNLEELHNLAYMLNVEFDDLQGQGPTAKARELVELLNRQNRLADLVPLCQDSRPDVPWARLAGLESEDDDGTGALPGRPSVFETDLTYVPSADRPLIYHLLGLETYPASIIFTEDDYLDFLVAISADSNIVPKPVMKALANSSLLLLGYDLQDWAFRVLFRGLIAQRRSALRLLSVAIQLAPAIDETGQPTDIDSAQGYLESYFNNAEFKIYWGSSKEFVEELWRHWEEAR